MVADLGERVSFADVLKFRRIAIAGGPRTGKTTLAAKIERECVIHTDDFEAPWAQIPRLVCEACRDRAEYVVEGVQVGRALRKGLACDVALYLNKPHGQLSKGQASMSRACATIFRSWLDTNPAVPVYLYSAWDLGGLPEFSRIS